MGELLHLNKHCYHYDRLAYDFSDDMCVGIPTDLFKFISSASMIKALGLVFLAEYFHVFSILRCRFPAKPVTHCNQWLITQRVSEVYHHKYSKSLGEESHYSMTRKT